MSENKDKFALWFEMFWVSLQRPTLLNHQASDEPAHDAGIFYACTLACIYIIYIVYRLSTPCGTCNASTA